MSNKTRKITSTGNMKWPRDDSDMAKRMLEMFIDGTFDPSDFSVTGNFFVTLAICETGGQGGFFNLFLICYFFLFSYPHQNY